jgi:hypothetical protein
MTFLSVHEISVLEQVSDRQVQRYISEGFKGQHKLSASRVGKRLVVAAEDYTAWRIACGFEQPEAQPKPAQPVPQVSPPAEPRPEPETMFRPANANGVLTNCPHPNSSNFASPQTCREYLENAARQMKAGAYETD